MTEHKNQIILELTVKYNNMIFRAERTAEDKNDALDSAIDKIIRQIRKNKTRIEKSLKDTAFKELYADQVDEQVDYEIIKHKTFVMRPMDVEEAILQMNMLGHSFFMFCNAQTGGTNVVYKRRTEITLFWSRLRNKANNKAARITRGFIYHLSLFYFLL